MSGFKAVIVLFFITVPISVMAQTLPTPEMTESTNQFVSNSLRGKHRVDLSIGLLSEMSATNEVSTGTLTTRSKGNGSIGSIGYTYWLEDDLAINFSVGVIDADATTSVGGSGVSAESAVVVPVLFGVKYQPFRLTASEVLRPYVSVSVGPFFGFASDVRTGVATGTKSFSETALGSRLGVGIDVSLSKIFTLGVGAGYLFVTDFDNRIGSEKNYSGPEFSLSLGMVFGKGKN